MKMSPADKSSREESDSEFYRQVTPRQMECILSRELGARVEQSEGLHRTSDDSSIDMPTMTLEEAATFNTGNSLADDINNSLQTFKLGKDVYSIVPAGNGQYAGECHGKEPVPLGFSYQIEESIMALKRLSTKNAGLDEE
jgi:hypothetical protein